MAVEKNPGAKKALGGRAPAVFARRFGWVAARHSAPNRATIPIACRARHGGKLCLSALSLKNRDGKIIVVDKLELEEAKTKLMVKALAELKVQSALIVIAEAGHKDRAFGAQSAESQSAAGRGFERL